MYNVPIQKHTITDLSDTAGLCKLRGFSPQCQVLTNSSGKQCHNCYKTKDRIDLKNQRRASKQYAHVEPTTNHRYMTKEEMAQKIANEKAKYLHEKRLRERFEKELLEMEKSDHADLSTLMDQVSKKDIPNDMLLLWEEQKKILTTTSQSRYRWHPR